MERKGIMIILIIMIIMIISVVIIILSAVSKDKVPAETEPKTKIIPPIEVDIMQLIADHFGLDKELIQAIVQVESGGDPKAVGDNGNSIGLMQIQPKWHKRRMARYGFTEKDLYSPICNLIVGCDYLKECMDMGNGIDFALMMYNGGMEEAYRNYRSGTVTEYVKKVREAME